MKNKFKLFIAIIWFILFFIPLLTLSILFTRKQKNIEEYENTAADDYLDYLHSRY